ncbi:hypothetical protein GCM10020256_03990 [Streptomyces thermocoprophilus]
MDDAEAQAAEVGAGHLGEPGAQFGAVVVAVHADETPAVRLEQVEGGGVGPVPGVQDDIGARQLRQQRRGQSPCPLRQVGVGRQQQAHGSSVGQGHRIIRRTVQSRLDSLTCRT